MANDYMANKGGRGVGEMLTLGDEGGRGVWTPPPFLFETKTHLHKSSQMFINILARLTGKIYSKVPSISSEDVYLCVTDSLEIFANSDNHNR